MAAVEPESAAREGRRNMPRSAGMSRFRRSQAGGVAVEVDGVRVQAFAGLRMASRRWAAQPFSHRRCALGADRRDMVRP